MSRRTLLYPSLYNFDYGTFTLFGLLFQYSSSIIKFCNSWVNGLLLFRSPLLKESIFLSFPTVTKMFQFTAFPHIIVWQPSAAGFPHSDTDGSLFTYNSPSLFVVRHVLLRLLVPRHSPYALLSLTLLYSIIHFSKIFLLLVEKRSRSPTDWKTSQSFKTKHIPKKL